ncbi:MAG: crotonobetainyl-CoA hydratase [Alphaproteobacteria bacterium]|nr:crotonobetainyl-CoA hydratase [Alphaproteobacteria bacterium]
MSEPVKVVQHGQILEVTLDRPPANAINGVASRGLGAAFVRLRDDPALRVAIVTGGGEKFFSGGWDLKAAASGDADATDYGPGGFAGLTELCDLDKPVIAAVNGYAAGGGFELALAADVIVAVDHAQFFLPEAKVGILPDGGGINRLPRRIPYNVALEMMLTGRRMPAQEAYARGLVTAVVQPADLMAKAREIAAQICESAPLSVKAIKHVLRAIEPLTVEQSIQLMRDNREAIPAYAAMWASEDAREGPRAFAEKRKPNWKGK